MSRSAVSWLAWSLWALSLASAVASVVLRSLTIGAPKMVSQEPLVFDIWFLLVSLSFATVGALVASRQPGNAIGWIFCALGVCNSLAVAGQGYAIYALLTGPAYLTGGAVANWLSSLLAGPIVFAMFALVLLLFPDGRPLSRRWRPFVWLDLIAVALIFVFAFKPGPLDTSLLDANNPFGIEGAGALLEALGIAGIFLTLAVAIAGAVSLVLRLRRSRGDERQQLKWFVFAGAVFCAAFATGPVLWSLPPSSGFGWIWTVLFLSAVSTIPAATGIAMLKYRLYDIDLVINKTLVYVSLTATLAFAYLGGVISSQYILRTLTGGGSQLAVVASTLIIAAMFNPFRRRIQGFIDRLFYRRKYDAAKTLETFSAKLRDETDLDALGDELVVAVRETMQPEHASLWLRDTEEVR
ncbi:MAG: hypothetical protein ACRDTR_17670 [Rubrobacter sp.]